MDPPDTGKGFMELGRGLRMNIYLDNCATTPVAPEVADVMDDITRHNFGNPSSIHAAGRQAAQVLASARATIAGSLGARADEIVFTASGTEANNLAIAGTLQARSGSASAPLRVITTAVEHASVKNRLLYEQRLRGPDNLEITYIPIDDQGQIDACALGEATSRGADLVTILFGNNETGILQNLESLKELKLRHPALPVHLDIVQSYGKISWDCRALPFDMLTICAHKIHGPKGAAALYIRNGFSMEPLFVGGGQEKFRRPGTEDVAAVAGFAKAVELLPSPESAHAHFLALEQAFFKTMEEQRTEYWINGPSEPGEKRLPGFFNLSFPGCANKEDLQIALDLEGICASSTSACHSGVVADSHVLKAMGLEENRRNGSIRILFNRFQDIETARKAGKIISDVVRRIQNSRKSASPAFT